MVALSEGRRGDMDSRVIGETLGCIAEGRMGQHLWKGVALLPRDGVKRGLCRYKPVFQGIGGKLGNAVKSQLSAHIHAVRFDHLDTDPQLKGYFFCT